MRNRWALGILLMITELFCPAAEVVRYPALSAAHDPNRAYVVAVLQLALAKSGKSYDLVSDPTIPMQQGRAIAEARSATGKVDVIWTMTTKEREAQLLPIRIPIDKGLLGWRIPLLDANRTDLLSELATLTDLQRWKAGQGHDWPDTEILRSNGLNVVTSCCYDTLFSMMLAGRFDYFPRSIMEIWVDIANHPTMPLVADSHVVIHYPAAAYFFVSPRRPRLAKDLQTGLERAIADGSFEAVFQAQLGPYIERAQLGRRRIIELTNPLLDVTSLPLERPELWYRP